MQYRKIGHSDIDASVVAFGAWAIGGWMWGGAEETAAIAAIHTALDAGINFIDTAPAYGFGRSEEIVGKAIRDRRDRVVLATKCGLVWDREKGVFHFHSDEQGPTAEPSKLAIYKYLAPDSIVEEFERSLKRLQTDHIDLYQIHWQDDSTPITDTMAALLKLKDQGKIRAIGVSNCSLDQLKAYGPVDTDQERYSMLDRKIEHNGLLDYCRRNNISMLAHSPLEQGLLTGKITPDRQFRPRDQRLGKPTFSAENRRRIMTMLDQFQPIAEKYDATLTQLTIAWTFSRPGLTHVLCGARNPAQAAENAAAGRLTLDPEDLNTITNIVADFL